MEQRRNSREGEREIPEKTHRPADHIESGALNSQDSSKEEGVSEVHYERRLHSSSECVTRGEHQPPSDLQTTSEGRQEVTMSVDVEEGRQEWSVKRCSKSVNITFRDLCYTAPGSSGDQAKLVLKSVSGRCLAGRLTAILGPSGAGKTSLLNVLTGYRTTGMSGSVLVNGQPRRLEQFRRQSCYIEQEFAMLQVLTVRETMQMAADLKLGADVRSAVKRSAIAEILEMLGLSSTCDTVVSSISGGEKKRLSLAVELITDPPVMFFDEPTSGLDSCSSAQVVSHLKLLAAGGHTVACVVHQPSSRLFGMFDDVLVLSEGRCLYCGPVQDMLSAFSAVGFHCPQYYNRADFVIEVAYKERGENLDLLVSKNSELHAQALKKPANTDEVPSVENNQDISDETTVMLQLDSDSGGSIYAVGIILQLWILFKRSLVCNFRDTYMAQIRVLMHIVIALVLGAVYYGIGNDAAKVPSNMSLLFFSLMFVYFANAMPTVQTFPVERDVFLREHLNNWYSLFAYYLAKLFAEVPLQVVCPTLFLLCAYFMSGQPNDVTRFALLWLVCCMLTVLALAMGLVIGAIFQSQLGVFLVASVNIPMLLFSGFFMRLDEMPQLVRALAYLSYYRYGFEAAMLATYGFGRANLNCSQPFCQYKSPEKLLHDMKMEHASYAVDIAAIAGWILVFQVAFLVVLKWKVRASR